jgi:hypothetical protein
VDYIALLQKFNGQLKLFSNCVELVNLRHKSGVLHLSGTPLAVHSYAYADKAVHKHSQSPPISHEHVSILNSKRINLLKQSYYEKLQIA